MVFIQGTYDAPTIVATIANALKATDDFEEHDTGVSEGYCLRHIPTGQYLHILCERATSMESVNTSYNIPGIAFKFASSWDSALHKWDDNGNKLRGFFPMYTNSIADLTPITAPNKFNTAIWVDKYGVIMTLQNNYSYGAGGIMAVEFFPSAWVEYDDTQPEIVFFARMTSHWSTEKAPSTTFPPHEDLGAMYARPYRFYSGVDSDSQTQQGVKYLYPYQMAHKSEGNNKCYFDFPWYENDEIAARKPYAQTRRWFQVSNTGGFSIGDILNWIDPDDVTVHKYIVTVVTAGNLYYAIPYENAFDYAVSAKQ